MTAYRCLVISREGRTDWRVIDAPDQHSAVTRLVADGLTPLDISNDALSLVERLNRPVRLGRTLSIGDQALIMTQLGTLIRSGLPVDRSLDLLREQAPRARQRDLLAQVVAHVRGGGALASGLDQLASFPAYVIGVVRSAERSGKLGDALETLARRLSLAAATRRQLLTALTYPAAVLIATFLALALVLTLVIPQFEPIFEGQEDKLPQITQLVLALSRLVTEHGWALIATIVAVPIALSCLLRTPAGMELINRHRRHIPGMIMRDQYIAGQFIGIFSTLIGNGVSVVNALPLARDAVGSHRWRRHIEMVESAVRGGSRLSAALSKSTLIPSAAIRLIETGERSGQLASTCREASGIIGENVRAKTERGVALANPMAIVSLGGLVGMLVAGVMLGIFSLGDFAQ